MPTREAQLIAQNVPRADLKSTGLAVDLPGTVAGTIRHSYNQLQLQSVTDNSHGHSSMLSRVGLDMAKHKYERVAVLNVTQAKESNMQIYLWQRWLSRRGLTVTDSKCRP